jgi:hypothetical protein
MISTTRAMQRADVWSAPRLQSRLLLGAVTGIVRALLATALFAASYIVSGAPLRPLAGSWPSYGSLLSFPTHLILGVVAVLAAFVEDVSWVWVVFGLHGTALAIDLYSVVSVLTWLIQYHLDLLTPGSAVAKQMTSAVAIFNLLLLLVLVYLSLMATLAYFYVARRAAADLKQLQKTPPSPLPIEDSTADDTTRTRLRNPGYKRV